MKNFLIFLFFLLYTITLLSQTVIKPYEIVWQPVQKWYINDHVKKVLYFNHAKFPNDNLLPVFSERFLLENSQNYEVKIINEKLVQLPDSEASFVQCLSDLKPDPVLTTGFYTEKNQNYIEVNILPFAKRDGSFFKLTSFDLELTPVAAPQKVSKTTIHSYADKSVLSQGKFFQIRVANSGIYKLTYEDLNTMGINPANVKIYGYGGAVLNQDFRQEVFNDLPEISIYMNKGTDGIFNAGDYILFYAQGINSWTLDKTNKIFLHKINSYSSYGYYFVTSGETPGKRIQDVTLTLPENKAVYNVEEFLDYQVYEKELRTIISSGKEFFGEVYNETSTKTFSFNVPNVISSANAFKLRIDLVASSTVQSAFNVNLNGAQTKTVYVDKKADNDTYDYARNTTTVLNFTPGSDNLQINLTYTKPTTTSIGYLNYMELNLKRYLKMSGSVMQFQNVDNVDSDGYNHFMVSDCNTNVQIWDITDQQNIKNIKTESVNGKMSFYDSATNLKTYLAIDPTNSAAFNKPEMVGAVENQNLHGLSSVDMVIITNPKFIKQAETLAEAHRKIDNLTVAVVTTSQVYNEFSSGTPDATAYRWVMKMLYDRAMANNDLQNLPKYLLLFGRGSFDNRGVIPSSGNNLILTYQTENSMNVTSSYVTDDYFGFLNDNEGTQIPSDLMDIGVGRFPVVTVTEADDVVNKTISYMKNEKKGIWKNQLCFIADDGDGALHMRQADTIASGVSRNFKDYQLNKIYLDAYNQEISASGQSYPVARTQFLNLIQNGLFLLDYTGHAGYAGWTNELVLTSSDVISMSNKCLPLWVGATCDFLQFDVETVSAGEHVLLNPNGGGIGIISAARPVYAAQNMYLNKYICDNLFKRNNEQHYRVGDVITIAKNSIGAEINKLSYIYMGDPAVKLNYPTKYKVVTSKINDNSESLTDTLKALSVAKISGFIADQNNDTVNGFSGELNVNIYDKVQRITTLNNEGDGTLTYNDRPNILFSGKANIVNGKFTFSFMLPKDIKYNYGAGRINYYAYDKNNLDDEAQGSFENFIVGGTSKSVQYETDGPQLNMYLNNENFVSGNKVNETPLFVAKINDQSGINKVGSGIGHDLLITIDDDPKQSYILNDYYNADADSYTSGVVKYRLPQMIDGKHSLTFRVWDLLNNSTTSSLDFEVVNGLSPEIFSISNYPNPVKTNTHIVLNYDRPETVIDTKVEIFDISGRKVWYFEQSNADEINWNLTTLNGVKAKTGIYLYRVTLTNGNKEIYSKMNKMIILEQ